jgi:hypothetical protein
LLEVALVLVAFHLLVDPRYHFFVGLLLPDAVTAHYNEVKSCLEGVLIDIRVRCDSLFFGLELLLSLVFKVAKRSC